MYAGGSRYVQDGTANDVYLKMTPDELAKRFPFVIQSTVAWDHDTLQAHRHHVGDLSYHHSSMRAAMVMKALEGYIKELGYTAIRGAVNPQGAGLAAGLGELGRNGMMITERFGARVHMPDPILTDMPLFADGPIDIGVADFCNICRKCASNCPTNSITFGPKIVYNGIEKYKINWLTCYKIRPFVSDHYISCLTCIAVCPFTKPDAWWRRVGGKLLKTTPIQARPPVVRAFKWIDDKFWGEFPRSGASASWGTTRASRSASTTAPTRSAPPTTRSRRRSSRATSASTRPSRSRPTTSSSGARRWPTDLVDCRACVTTCHACAALSESRGGGPAPVTIRTGMRSSTGRRPTSAT